MKKIVMIHEPDWALLRNQKALLLNLTSDSYELPMGDKELIDGVINFIDHVQDRGVDRAAGVTEADVFGEVTE